MNTLRIRPFNINAGLNNNNSANRAECPRCRRTQLSVNINNMGVTIRCGYCGFELIYRRLMPNAE